MIFSTKGRAPFLRDLPLRSSLYGYIAGILKDCECPVLIINGVEDHLHILCLLSRTRTAADLVKETKRGSSLWLKREKSGLENFAWQSGYGVFSVSQSQVEATRKYIENQEEHHRKVSFQDEFRDFLRRYEVEYNEQYVWD